MFFIHNSFVLEKMLEKEQKNKAIYYEMALYQWQGQKDLVSPAGSVGASAPLGTLRIQYSKRLILTKSEIVRFAHGEIICSANCDI